METTTIQAGITSPLPLEEGKTSPLVLIIYNGIIALSDEQRMELATLFQEQAERFAARAKLYDKASRQLDAAEDTCRQRAHAFSKMGEMTTSIR